jgi:hypothetical protein
MSEDMFGLDKSEGLFGDLDIASASIVTGPPADAYKAIITRFERAATRNDENKFGLNITYTRLEGEWEGYDEREWLWIPTGPEPTEEEEKKDRNKARTKIKKRLVSLGVPEKQMNNLDPEVMLNLEVIITTAMKSQPDDRNPTYLKGVVLASSTNFRPSPQALKGTAKANPFA